MSGYSPLFSSLTTGTLCGRWPDIGLWPIVLSLADRRGVVDVTPQYIAGVTGLPVDEVAACMKRFCQPDPYSRSSSEEGRRLVLLDPEHRDWGWKIVNYGMYRERARKMAFDAVRVEDGRNAERMAERRADATRDDPTQPAMTRDDPPSNNTKQDPDLEIGQKPSAFDRFWDAYPKKVKRKTAAEIWNRKRLDSQADRLVADVAHRLEADRRWREGFVPDPTTYLNQERWNDQVDGTPAKKRGFVA